VLQPVAAAEASGLVPLKSEETNELDKRVAQFVDELAKLDSNSPEFGKKVDQLTAMGRKEIAEAAGASNRFLDRPVKAIDKDSGIGADLTELRRTGGVVDALLADHALFHLEADLRWIDITAARLSTLAEAVRS